MLLCGFFYRVFFHAFACLAQEAVIALKEAAELLA